VGHIDAFATLISRPSRGPKPASAIILLIEMACALQFYQDFKPTSLASGEAAIRGSVTSVWNFRRTLGQVTQKLPGCWAHCSIAVILIPWHLDLRLAVALIEGPFLVILVRGT